MSKNALIQVIEGIADNKYVLGDRLALVGFSAPDIESCVASMAMAQGELGHSRILYHWVLDIKGHKGKKPDISNETGKSFTELRKIDGWVKLIAGFYVTNVAMDVILDAMIESNNPDVRSNINKLYLEHKEHCIYSEGWALKLLNDIGGVPRKFKEELNKILPQAEAWLKEVETIQGLDEYIVQKNLLSRFQEQIAKVTGIGAVTNA
ncbi:Phenylacetic acid catabolic protein [Calidifontibacillus erzurumensis]|uniref:Phenylacetate-CoA oxygenase subunit PaaI n=1 Tax=Calidifontibacillus erzurumensis TaxID=2741433 RepID=A0A8J8K7A3_9BACI|nr:Phenylacetic acid catabolic protein [Calidifontibacillus erzurumensis]NSL50541.1 phenylacetate-CoA oxygenase subunit PaaI [Calidifontibacillus erzurumensis]